MDCPKCKISKLEEKTFGAFEGKKIKVDICFLCGGIWFDKGELEETLKLENKPVDTKEYIKTCIPEIKYEDLNCPRCNGKLIEKPSKQDKRIKVDICEECGGIWLDCGELNVLQNRTNSFAQLIDKILGSWQVVGPYTPTGFIKSDED